MVSLSATWTKVTPSLPLHRSSLAVSIVGNKAFVVGGEKIPRIPLDSELFAIDLKDGKVDTFKPSSESSAWPSARVGSASTSVGTNIYLWGGRGGKAMTPSSGELWKFDTLASSFSLVPVAASLEGETPEDRSFHVLTSYKNTLYLHAGCPIKGRLPTLHSLDLSSQSPAWKQLPSAPGPGRGGTNLALLNLPSSPVFARFGGFAGVELSDFALFHPSTSSWSSPTTLFSSSSPQPSARSVAGFVGLPTPQPLPSSPTKSIVALLFLGEKECTAPSVGHDGAGVFYEDVWALTVDGNGEQEGSWEWVEASVKGGEKPEGLGWFGSGWWEGNGEGDKGGAVLVGGLQGENERRGDVWVLRVAEE